MSRDIEHSCSMSLITVDSLRADAIAPYDDARHTPVLGDLADRGAVFDRAFATGNWTPFSFPGIVASRPVFQDTGRIGVDGTPTLPEVLSDAGVTTGGFNAANGFLTSNWGYDAGFDAFEPFVANLGSSIYSQYLATHPTIEAWLQLATAPARRLGAWLRGNSEERPFLDSSRMFDAEHAAIDFLETTDDPAFLWVHYMDTHTPYVPAPRYIREVSSDLLGTHRMLHAHAHTGLGWEVGPRTLSDLRVLYQAAVRQVDASIGRLLDAIETSGRSDETAVIVAGDHGDEFQDHGHLAHYPKLYDELIHVPLIVDHPHAEPRRIDGHVGLDAIPPTVADLLDVDHPGRWVGHSLAASIETGKPPVDEPVVSVAVRGEDVTTQPIPRALDEGDLLVSVRDRDWTYIQNTNTGHYELYHRPTDPGQQHDLAAPTDTTAITNTGTNGTTDTDDTPTELDGTNTSTDDARAIIERFSTIVAEHAAVLRTAAENESGDGPAVDDDLESQLAALGYR